MKYKRGYKRKRCTNIGCKNMVWNRLGQPRGKCPLCCSVPPKLQIDFWFVKVDERSYRAWGNRST